MVSETLASDSLDGNDSEWDSLTEMSDVSDLPENFKPAHEKSEEEKSYEKRERYLKDELFSLVERRSRQYNSVAEDYSKIFHQEEHPMMNRVDSAFDNLNSSLKGTGFATLETLFAFVDSKFPSPFSEEVADARKQEELEDDFRRASLREGQVSSDNIDEFVKIFAEDGSQNDLHIANSIRHIGTGSYDFQSGFARAIIDYVNDPTDRTREQMVRVEADHEGVLTNALFNIASTFDESKTGIGPRLFDPTIALATNAVRGSQDIFDGVRAYLRFKMQNAAEKPAMKPNSELPIVPDRNVLIEPDVYLR
ncbi:hypothetical protein J6W91_01425 [Candidatus Saccharibacteria bacterium]|nr:hypothetical protein [Candidatus Saccharibacteria bacterium]